MTEKLELARQLAMAAVEAIWDKKGFDVVAMQVREIVQYTDFIVVASARNERQATAIADNVETALRENLQQKPIGEEGRRGGRWVLLDYGDIVVHVFHRPVRDYYELERLYADAPHLKLEEPKWVHEIGGEEGAEEAGEYNDLVWQNAKWAQGDEAALAEDDEAAEDDAADEEV